MISKEGEGGGGSQEGGGDSLTVEKEHAVEVKVEKLG
jgi:hypothetical protein